MPFIADEEVVPQGRFIPDEEPAVPDLTRQPRAATAPVPSPFNYFTGGGFERTRQQIGEFGKLPLAEKKETALTPTVQLPKFTVQPDDSFIAGLAKESANQLIGLPEFATSPVSIATAGVGPVAGKIGQTAIRVGFLADTIYNFLKQAPSDIDAYIKASPGEKGAMIARWAGTGALAGTLASPEIKRAGDAIKRVAPILPRAAAAAEEAIAEAPPVEQPAATAATPEVTSASEIRSTAQVPEHEVRPQVGEETPLRQQGEPAPAGAPEAPAAEVAPEIVLRGEKGTYPITFDAKLKHLVDAEGRLVDAEHNLIESPPPSTGPTTEAAASTETPTTTPQPSEKAGAALPEAATETTKRFAGETDGNLKARWDDLEKRLIELGTRKDLAAEREWLEIREQQSAIEKELSKRGVKYEAPAPVEKPAETKEGVDYRVETGGVSGWTGQPLPDRKIPLNLTKETASQHPDFESWSKRHSKPVATSLAIIDSRQPIKRIEGTSKGGGLLPFSIELGNGKFLTKATAIHKYAEELLSKEPAPPPAAPAAKEPWQMTKAELAGQTKFNKAEYGSLPWSAEVMGKRLVAPEMDFDHPDLGKTRISGAIRWNTKKQAQAVIDEIHKRLISKALSEGKPVPAKVLADYPDLKPPAPPAEAKPTPPPAATEKAAPAAATAKEPWMMTEGEYFESQNPFEKPEFVSKQQLIERETEAYKSKKIIDPKTGAIRPPTDAEVAEYVNDWLKPTAKDTWIVRQKSDSTTTAEFRTEKEAQTYYESQYPFERRQTLEAAGEPLAQFEKSESQKRHRVIVEEARKQGKPVPAEVLADYPDLNPPAPKPAEARAETPTPPAAKLKSPKVGEVFASMGDYEFALTKGQLEGRPDMYGVGVRRIGSTQPFESGGYGYRVKPADVIERWAEMEIERGEQPELKHPLAESLWKSESERISKRDAEKAAAEESKRAAEEKKASTWNEYQTAVDSTPLPTGKKTTITAPAKDGSTLTISGTAYGDWLISKNPSKYSQSPYDVTHSPSGFRVSGDGFATLAQAKQYVKALIQADIPTKWTKKEQVSDADLNRFREVGKAWLAGGDVPSHFKAAEPTPPPHRRPRCQDGDADKGCPDRLDFGHCRADRVLFRHPSPQVS